MGEHFDTSHTAGPCCQRIEDMLKYAQPILGKWPPFYRYTLGEQMQNEMLTMLRLATKARLRYYNKTTLADLDTSKAVLECFLRQANEIEFTDRSGNRRRLITDKNFESWSLRITEIGKIIGGWIQSVQGRK